MALVPSPEARYRSIFEAFSKIIRTEHPRALFRGIGVVAGGAGPAHALYFSCYEVTKKYLTKANTRSTALAQGVCVCVCVLPLSIILLKCPFCNTLPVCEYSFRVEVKEWGIVCGCRCTLDFHIREFCWFTSSFPQVEQVPWQR